MTVESQDAKAPGTTPGTAAVGMHGEGSRWYGWVRIMLREQLTSVIAGEVACLEHVEMMGSVAGGTGDKRLLAISAGVQPSAAKAREVLDQIVAALSKLVGYDITIETYEDGQ